jgi:endonuclease/exonuclease/phosphatase family metal-dependent hydrolase
VCEAEDVGADTILVGDWNKPPDASEWRAFHKLEDQGKAVFRKANDTSDVSHLMYRSATEYGSRLDLAAMSLSASEQLLEGADVARFKTLDELLDVQANGRQIKQLIRDLSRDVSDHMPIVMRFFFTEEEGRQRRVCGSKRPATQPSARKKKSGRKR